MDVLSFFKFCVERLICFMRARPAMPFDERAAIDMYVRCSGAYDLAHGINIGPRTARIRRASVCPLSHRSDVE